MDCSENELLPVWASMTTTLITLGCLAGGVVAYSYRAKRSSKSSVSEEMPLVDNFLSARGTQGVVSNALSLSATAFGVWTVTGFPEVAAYASWGGLVGYAVGCVIPWLSLIILAPLVMKAMGGRGLTSLDFFRDRFGLIIYGFATALSVVTILLSLTASFVAIGGAISYVTEYFSTVWIIVLVAATSLIYISVTGLPGSILSDKVQSVGLLALLCVISVVIYVELGRAGIDFEKFQQATDPYPGASPSTTAFVLIFSMFCVEGLNQSSWQRMYSAKDSNTAMYSLALASTLVFPVYIYLGTFGFSAVAAREENLICLPEGQEWASFYALVSLAGSGWKVLFLILSLLMSTSSVDSHQSALLAIVGGPVQARGWSVNITRLIVALLQVPPVLLAASEPPSILTLFMVGNFFATLLFPLLVLGLSPYISFAGSCVGIVSGAISFVSLGTWYLDKSDYGPFRGFKWILFPEPYGFYSLECLITFIVCPLAVSIASVLGTFVQSFFYKETIETQRAILERLKVQVEEESQSDKPTKDGVQVDNEKSETSVSTLSDNEEPVE